MLSLSVKTDLFKSRITLPCIWDCLKGIIFKVKMEICLHFKHCKMTALFLRCELCTHFKTTFSNCIGIPCLVCYSDPNSITFLSDLSEPRGTCELFETVLK